MALAPAFLDELRARTPMAALVSRTVKLTRAGKASKGCCPFHGEKSPSFYVYDDGYHCFGCGAHGDAISFVMNIQGSNFIDAVEALAAEAGLEVPKQTPAAAEAERERLDLTQVLDLVAGIYQRRLHEPGGAAALAYLRGRGLSDATIARFGLGWSGDGRGLIADLGRDGIDPARMAEAGLLQDREDGSRRELFYNRVMFPIRDRRGRTISFGGRGLGDARPKYINGPETAAFSKRRSLYALDFAREGARSGPVIVAEGYMDVIALHQAGFAGAVAPLGTALTAEQLELLWRMSDAPVLCFDGDAAGGRAAGRAAEVALPLLQPDRTLSIATLPAGEDPDTLVRARGRAGFDGVLAAARPLSVALFDLLREGHSADTPEARAAFLARLDAAANAIPDRTLSAEYRRTLRDRVFTERQATRRGVKRPAIHTRMAPVPQDAVTQQHRALLAILLIHPDLVGDVQEALSALALTPDMAILRHAIVHWWDRHPVLDPAQGESVLDSDSLMNHLHSCGLTELLEQVLAARPVPLPACARPGAMPAEAEAGWWHYFGLLHRARLEEEVAAAASAFIADPDAAAQGRLIALCAARDALSRDMQAEDTEAGV